MTQSISKFTLAFLSNHFPACPKLDVREKDVREETFLVIGKGKRQKDKERVTKGPGRFHGIRGIHGIRGKL